MADVSALKIGEVSYNIKDKTSRTDIATINSNITKIENNMMVANYDTSSETIFFNTGANS